MGICRGVLVLPLLSLLITTPLSAKRRSSRARREPVIAALTKDGKPNVQAAAALVVDLASGDIVYAKESETPRNIASTTKIFVAMTVRRHKLKLEGITEITSVDKLYAKGGARTHLYEGDRVSNIDLLRAMLIASDNRAPSALGRAVGLAPAELIAEMNRLARDLGLTATHFSDPSGLNGNTSTARDMAKAMKAFMKDPLLVELASTREAWVSIQAGARVKQVHYGNTNRLLHNPANHVLFGKTGYTDEAGYCLVVASEIGGRKLGMVFLGAVGEYTRYGDYARIKTWLGGNNTSAALPVASVATSL